MKQIAKLVLLALPLWAPTAPAAENRLPDGLKSVEVDFGRGHRRDRTNVHFPPHPDSDTVYRIQIFARTTDSAKVTRLRLVKLPAKVVLDVTGGEDASVDLARIADDDARTPVPDYDGSYQLRLQLDNGQAFQQTFVAKEMNSFSTPGISSHPDCEVLATDRPRFAWQASLPQREGSPRNHTLNFSLIIHPVVEPWATVVSADLPFSATSFQVGDQPLREGAYRDVVTEKFVQTIGAIQVARSAWNARAFVIGDSVACD